MFRHPVMMKIVKMGHHPVAGRQRIARDTGQVLCPTGCVIEGKRSAPVLPCIQGTDAVPVPVQIHDPVHLPGHADGPHIRMAREQLLQQGRHPLQNHGRILQPRPAFGRQERIVGDGFCQNRAHILFIHHCRNGSGSNVQTQCFHRHTRIIR